MTKPTPHRICDKPRTYVMHIDRIWLEITADGEVLITDGISNRIETITWLNKNNPIEEGMRIARIHFGQWIANQMLGGPGRDVLIV